MTSNFENGVVPFSVHVGYMWVYISKSTLALNEKTYHGIYGSCRHIYSLGLSWLTIALDIGCLLQIKH